MDILRNIGAWFLDLVRKQGGGFVAGVGLALVFAIVMSASWPHISAIFDLGFWSEGGKDVSRLDVVRNLSLVAGGALGICLAVWRSYTAQDTARTANRQAYLVEQGQITDRFSSAIKMLSSESSIERIGAIHTLAWVAKSDIENYHIPVMKILAQFIADYRVNYARDDDSEFEIYEENYFPDKNIVVYSCIDFRTAISVCSQRSKGQLIFEDKNDFIFYVKDISFYHMDFTGIEIKNITLKNCSFNFCNIFSATFNNCYIDGVIFRYNYFDDAVFMESSVQGSEFIDNSQRFFSIYESSIKKSKMHNCDLFNVNIVESDVFKSIFDKCSFKMDIDGLITDSSIRFSRFIDCEYGDDVCSDSELRTRAVRFR